MCTSTEERAQGGGGSLCICTSLFVAILFLFSFWAILPPLCLAGAVTLNGNVWREDVRAKYDTGPSVCQFPKYIDLDLLENTLKSVKLALHLCLYRQRNQTASQIKFFCPFILKQRNSFAV